MMTLFLYNSDRRGTKVTVYELAMSKQSYKVLVESSRPVVLTRTSNPTLVGVEKKQNA